MTSSNLIRLALIEETAYGVTPAVGNFKTLRFNSEKFSGTPLTVESEQIRDDRLSSGQVATGLEVTGEIEFELARDATFDLLLKSAMCSDWVTTAPVVVDLSVNVTTKTLTRATGDWNTSVAVGDILILTGFVDTNNNTQVQVMGITSATVLSVAMPQTMTTEVGTGNSFKVADKLTIGTGQTAFSVEKSFGDLTNKAINYRGNTVGELNINVAYGEIVKCTCSLSGNDHEPVDAAVDWMTNGRTIDAAATTQAFNGSIDMPFIISSLGGTLTEADYCMNSVELKLNNNLRAQNCIGEAAPVKYNLGTAQVDVSVSSYLSDSNWSAMAAKIAQTPSALGFQIKNADGWYGFYLPAIQLSFDDPAAEGANSDVMLDMSGKGKVGVGGISSLIIYRS